MWVDLHIQRRGSRGGKGTEWPIFMSKSRVQALCKVSNYTVTKAKLKIQVAEAEAATSPSLTSKRASETHETLVKRVSSFNRNYWQLCASTNSTKYLPYSLRYSCGPLFYHLWRKQKHRNKGQYP